MDNWPQLAYQYGIGGMFFALTMFLCIRDGAVDRRVPSDRWTVLVGVAGLAAYLALHALWIILAS